MQPSSLMLALGDYRFSIDTASYQTLQRTTSYNWQSQQRIGQRPAQQFLGLGSDVINLTGVIYPHFKGGLSQLQSMREQALKGSPLQLADGLGQIWQSWIIKQIDETQTYFDAGGLPLKIEFKLQIERYGDESGL